MQRWLQFDMTAKLEFGIEFQSRKKSHSYLLSAFIYYFHDFSHLLMGFLYIIKKSISYLSNFVYSFIDDLEIDKTRQIKKNSIKNKLYLFDISF